jgi:hypothetical protein
MEKKGFVTRLTSAKRYFKRNRRKQTFRKFCAPLKMHSGLKLLTELCQIPDILMTRGWRNNTKRIIQSVVAKMTSKFSCFPTDYFIQKTIKIIKRMQTSKSMYK